MHQKKVNVEINVGIGILAFSKQATLQFRPNDVKISHSDLKTKPTRLTEAGLQ